MATGHRAMADVQNMKRIFTTKLSSVLENLTIKTKVEIEEMIKLSSQSLETMFC